MHPLKEFFPFATTELGIEILAKDVHFEKERLLINVTEEGIIISVNDEKPKNAKSPIFVIDRGIINFANFLHL